MKTPHYAALGLHSRYSVLGSMDYDGNTQPKVRFPTNALLLRKNIEALRQKKRPIYLTMEAGAFTRWASAIARPLVERLIICEPRHIRLINSNPTKSDEADVEGMCLLVRLGKLKEVWMGLRLHGIKVFSVKHREEYLEQLPAEEERRMMGRLYGQFDHGGKDRITMLPLNLSEPLRRHLSRVKAQHE